MASSPGGEKSRDKNDRRPRASGPVLAKSFRCGRLPVTVEIVITHSVRSGPKPMHYEIYAL